MVRKGRPELIISDNTAQFKLVKTVIEKQWKQLFFDEEVVTDKGIPGSLQPYLHLGKVLVGLVKRCLRKAIGAKPLRLAQFVVILSEVEAVPNTKPLTYV